MLRWLFGRRPTVATREAFVEFLAGQAAFVSQKCTIEYCRARAGLNWDKLFKEAAFIDALENCRWEAFGAVLSDVAVVAEGRLREPAGARAAELGPAIANAVGDAVNHFGPPPREPAMGWFGVAEDVRTRIARAQLAPPRRAHEIGMKAGERVYDTLPVHPDIRAHDRELVTNNIRFNLAQMASTLDDRFDPGLAGALLDRRV